MTNCDHDWYDITHYGSDEQLHVCGTCGTHRRNPLEQPEVNASSVQEGNTNPAPPAFSPPQPE